MTCFSVFGVWFEDLFVWLSVTIKISLKSRCHAEIIDEKRMLINVLKYAEFAFLDRKLCPLFEIVVRI